MVSFEEFMDFCIGGTTFIESEILKNVKSAHSWDIKNDGTRVTKLDLLIEDKIRELITKKFPSHGILGEERPAINKNAEFTWIIDPIDGTFGFTKGVPLFGSLIGLLYKGEPLYGFMRLPQIGNSWLSGDGNSTFHNFNQISAKPFKSFSNTLILTTDQQSIENSSLNPYWTKALNLGAIARTWGDCFGYYMLALGEAEIMADVGLNPYDILPIVPILLGTGLEIQKEGCDDYKNIISGKKEAISALFA